MSSEQIRAEVNTICVHAFVTFHATYMGQTTRDKWECDEWRLTLKKEFAPGDYRSESFEFFTGLGLRKPDESAMAKISAHSLKKVNKRALAWEEHYKRYPDKPQTPHVADLLNSLILDSSAVGQSFESWCSELGYDSDSRKAEATYRACQQNADKLARIFNRNDIAALKTALQDY